MVASEIAFYDLAGRTAQRHRGEIRHFTGFRECSVGDVEKPAERLAAHVTGSNVAKTGSVRNCSPTPGPN